MSSLVKQEIHVLPETGRHICACLRDAAILALQEDVVVKLKFNDVLMIIDPAAIVYRLEDEYTELKSNGI